jgi:uncharacterized protein YndB with AHSA1/START domain
MTALLIIVAALAAVFLGLRLIGSQMTRNHSAKSRILLAHPPAMVWATLRNQQEIPTWWPEVQRVERLPDRVGRERWVSHEMPVGEATLKTLGNGITMTLIVAESTPPNRMRTVVDAEPGAAFGGSWIYELNPSGEGTEVRISEESWLANPILRVFASLMGYHRTIDGYLRALARRFGETAEPTHLL